MIILLFCLFDILKFLIIVCIFIFVPIMFISKCLEGREYGVSIKKMLMMVGKTFNYENSVYKICSLVFKTSNGYPIASFVVERQDAEGTEIWIPEDVFKLIKKEKTKSRNHTILEELCDVITAAIISALLLAVIFITIISLVSSFCAFLNTK